MSKYYPPIKNGKAFHCIKCNVYAKQEWHDLVVKLPGQLLSSPFTLSFCEHCGEASYWYEDRMIIPSEAPVPPPHEDLPKPCAEEYEEAKDIVSRSPKAAAALLRLLVQKLMKELGENGKNINHDISELVKKGLPVQVQQALDYCRVIGNEAVHPGEISLTDNPDIAYRLFEMVNFIVDNRISQPKKIEEIFNSLPEGKKEEIKRRDQ